MQFLPWYRKIEVRHERAEPCSRCFYIASTVVKENFYSAEKYEIVRCMEDWHGQLYAYKATVLSPERAAEVLLNWKVKYGMVESQIEVDETGTIQMLTRTGLSALLTLAHELHGYQQIQLADAIQKEHIRIGHKPVDGAEIYALAKELGFLTMKDEMKEAATLTEELE